MASYIQPKRTSRRGRRPTYDPIRQRGEKLHQAIWERASKLAEVLAPDVPSDQEELTDHESWLILEAAALNLSPAAWDDPDALEDLYRLRKLFMPQLASEELKARAGQVRKQANMLPDPSITPMNPEWEKRIARLKR